MSISNDNEIKAKKSEGIYSEDVLLVKEEKNILDTEVSGQEEKTICQEVLADDNERKKEELKEEQVISNKSSKRKYCSRCGSIIDGESKKCTGCGSGYRQKR